VLDLFADETLAARALPHLLSRDPATFWTSGQWMTERSGGSDVGDTATVARRDGEGFRLHGSKWFTSATSAPMALTLARLEGAPAGSHGLTLFYLELRDARGELQGVRVLRLKDKLGTRALPTAELELDGVPARQVGAAGRGVATVATLLNVTRLYNACCATGTLARALQLARDYARRRRAFGRPLAQHALHVETLAGLAAEHASALQLTFRCAELCGREETGEATAAERALLRLLTPIAKAATGRQAVAGASEALEAFGGAGYVEDTGLPVLLRDAQVLSIWEGTTNVLALDALRAAAREEAMPPLVADLERLLAAARGGALVEAAHRLRQLAGACQAWWRRTAPEGGEALEMGARAFALGLGRAYAGALLVAQAAWELDQGDGEVAAAAVAVARRFAEGHLSAPPGLAVDAGAARRLGFAGEPEEDA
jgi:alkylation response protein AidB-like acyl-CoA dehydrogenase